MTKRVAIIGSGISGLTCGYLLNEKVDITLFEANDYLGGHTATIDVELGQHKYAIDTGFIVFNNWTYPHFNALLAKLEVAIQPTEMSFSVQNAAQDLEYNGHSLNTLFAQRRNLMRPLFYRFIADLLRFNKLCKATYSQGDVSPSQTLGDFLQQHGFSATFCENYVLPMCAAIWSTSLQDVRAFPLIFFLQFFHNHGLLNLTNRPQWYTVIGGSREYISPLTSNFRDKIRLSTPVKAVCKANDKWKVIANTDVFDFDEVIFACHSDQALALLQPVNDVYTSVLGKIKYAPNEVLLHTDDSVLPKRKRAWASWNYALTGNSASHSRPVTVTYNMNILQRLESETTFCVTLNDSNRVDHNKVLGRYHYAHPQFSSETLKAQQQRLAICGKEGLHFCGAYWYNGFHEDGVRSALDVCDRFGAHL